MKVTQSCPTLRSHGLYSQGLRVTFASHLFHLRQSLSFFSHHDTGTSEASRPVVLYKALGSQCFCFVSSLLLLGSGGNTMQVILNGLIFFCAHV